MGALMTTLKRTLKRIVRPEIGNPFVLTQTPQKCSVQLCGCTAACEIAIAGEWFPVCRAHAMNRLAPRRALSNAEVSDPATKTP